jgi:hypothetical protein
MDNPLPEFLPAPRSQCARSKLNGPYSSDFQSWTAGRCRRLLRPITSRIELLRRDRFHTAGNSVSIQDPPTASTIKLHKDQEGSIGDEACWASRRKRVRRTYSARRKSQDGSGFERVPGNLTAPGKRNQGHKASLQPGEFLVPTPILNRSKAPIEASGRDLVPDLSSMAPSKAKVLIRPHSRYATKNGELHLELSKTMRWISKTTNAATYKVYEGIYNSLEALFKATMPHDELAQLPAYDKSRYQFGSSSGFGASQSKSLLSMCLRSVPNWIKEEENRAAVEAGHKSAFDTRVISTEIYSDLESLGTAELGWKHLKTVVRIHGVQAISDAIQEGLLESHFASALVMLCVHTSSADDGERLLTSFLKAFEYPNPKSIQSHPHDDSALLPLFTVEKFVKHTERAGYYHRQVDGLITSGLLSMTWLGTNYFCSVWTSVFRCLSNDPSNRDATKFLTNILPLLCTAQSSSTGEQEDLSPNENSMLSALNNTLTSVLITLLSMSLLSGSHTRSISQILRSTIIDGQLASLKLDSHVYVLVAMANLLASVEVDQDASFMREIVESLAERCRQLSQAPSFKDRISSFVCSVARCCGRGSSGNGFEYLKILLERLMVFRALDNTETSWVLQEIIVDSAFVFQCNVPNEEHVQYAQHIRTRLHGSLTQPKASPSLCRTISEDGFRWEEGINEWVVATPATKLRGLQGIRHSLSDEYSDCENPIRQALKRHKRRAAPHAGDQVRSDRCRRVSDFAPASPNTYDEDVCPSIRVDHHNNDKSLPNSCPLQEPASYTQLRYGKRPIRKLRRLGHELLSSRQSWKIFEQSDDELNSTVATISDCVQFVFLELPNPKSSSHKQERKSNILENPLVGRDESLQEESEDELSLGLNP